jgi:hypothetical protein
LPPSSARCSSSITPPAPPDLRNPPFFTRNTVEN